MSKAMTNQGRRSFFRDAYRQIFQVAAAVGDAMEEARRRREIDSFFESYESSYALTLAYPDEIILETARQAGVETEGREKNDIVRELFEKQGRL